MWNSDEEMIPVMAYSATYKPSPESPWCNFNMGVMCDDKARCKSCGWNPVVDEKRKAKTRERLRNEQ